MTMRRAAKICAAAAFTSFVLLLGSFIGGLSAANAQADVLGTADFRNAPILPPGQFNDQIVSGDTAWYSFVYSNNTPYRFAVELKGPHSDELDLTASFVAPTLETIVGPTSEIAGSGVTYPGGHTNVWFLKVTLYTTGTPGVAHDIVLDIDGVESTRVEHCDALPDCSLDDEFEAVDERFMAASEELEIAQNTESTEQVRQEIDNLQGFFETAESFRPAAEDRLARAEATMARLCAPATTCRQFPDPSPQTALLGWLVGTLALGGGAWRLATKPRGQESKQDVDATKPGDRDASGEPKPSKRRAIAL